MKIELTNLLQDFLSVIKSKPYLIICIASFILAFWSCDDFVDVELPNSQLTTESVFKDKTTANAAMIQVYANMRDQGIFTGNSFGVSNLLGLYSDELDYYGIPQTAGETFYKNNVLPTTAEIKSMWSSSFNQIYGANAVIEGVRGSAALSQSDKNTLTGEALFTRALIHFYMANIFGNIPYIKTTDYKINSIIAKDTPEIIYKQCIEDLNTAVSLLSETYSTSDRTRPNKFAAHALLSKIYLYTKQWDVASNEASAVINSSKLYVLEKDLDKVFLKQSTSTIWQFAPSSSTGNTKEAQTFIFTSGPPPVVALSPLLLTAFETADQRKVRWISSVSKNNNTWYYTSKYKSRSTAVSTEFSVLLRLAELYLIRSEARAQSGDLIGSREDINVIRNNAGLENTTAVTQEQLLNAVTKERQTEFFTELGHRFFDLKRAGKLDSSLAGNKPNWETFENTLPLPASEILLNSNLNPQNLGY